MSYGGQILAALAGWPLWGIVLATMLPWFVVFGMETSWTYRHFHWLALFYVLVVTQGGHFLEHLTQMVQIHILDISPKQAKGVFGMLDVEWVHWTWNTWVLVATTILLFRYRRNTWLWLTFVFAGWHEIEHTYMLYKYLDTGVAGHPGFLGMGGIIANGLGIKRPNLHFIYNLLETAPMVLAFRVELKRSYNEWLAQAFPEASPEVLTGATTRLQTHTYRPGEEIVAQGSPSDAFYIISRGEVDVFTRDASGTDVHVRTMQAGDFFGEVGLLAYSPRTATVRAKSDVEVLRLDREGFRSVVEQSEATAEQLASVMRERFEKPTPAVT